MRPLIHFLLTTILCLAPLAMTAPAAVLIEVDDSHLSDPRGWRAVAAKIGAAEAAEADAIIIRIDAAGSHPEAAFRRVFDTLARTGVRTIAFVEGAAISAGAALALSTDEIYISPYGVIGAAIPEEGAPRADDGDATSEERTRDRDDRAISVVVARLKGMARSKGHDVDLVEALADPAVRWEVDGTVVKEAGRVLTMDAQAAAERGLVIEIVANLEALEEATGVSVDPEGAAPAPVVADGTAAESDAGADAILPPPFMGRDEGIDYAGKVVVMSVGEADLMAKARFDFMKRSLLKAEADGAVAVVFDMNTPGGVAWYTAELMMQAMQQIEIPTYTFVNPSAVSAGALIAIATDHIYMAPAATIGAAAVVSSTGVDLGESMQDKVNATFISVARNVAELKGHNPDIVEAFIDRNKEVVIEGVTISPAGSLLSLNTTTATEEFNGRPLLAAGVATNLDDLLRQAGLEGVEVIHAEPLGLEALAQWIQGISIFLIVLGIAGAYLEAQSPGFGLPGFISMFCFALFFFGNNLAGKLAGYELVVIFALGVILLAVEIFLLPGLGIAGIAGGLLMLGSLFFAMIDRLDVEAIRDELPNAPGIWEAVNQPLLTLALGIGGALLLIVVAMIYLPRTPAMQWMVLKEAVGGGVAAATAAAAAAPQISGEGVAVTDLRPEGRAQFGDDIVEVVAEGALVRAGRPLRVTGRVGRRVTVEEIG
ncbi:hypothetical protein BH23VER1_BH23VER1_24900 [soil metagenome]